MKRFYQNVEVGSEAQGFPILLDGQPVHTPSRNPLLLPNRVMAEAIAQEWRTQGDTIIPLSMPLTRLANTALDGVGQKRDEVIGEIMKFGAHDLLCYRAEQTSLAARQYALWDPLLEWLRARHGAQLNVTAGLVPISQPPEALARLRKAIMAHDAFALAALHDSPMVFQLCRLDEDFQAERWGRDAQAEVRAATMAREMDAAAAFLAAARD